MFVKKILNHTVNIPSNFLSSSLSQIILSQLYFDVENKTYNDHYLLLVLKIITISEGKIKINGDIIFKITYQALCLEIENNYILESKVIEINNMGIFTNIGPINIFVSHHQIPVNVKESIILGSVVRLRVKGVRYDNGISVVGSLNEEYLGVIL